MIDVLMNKIDNRKKGKSALLPFMREGMKMPCLIKDVAAFRPNIDSLDYFRPPDN
jgi:hypothetical protein